MCYLHLHDEDGSTSARRALQLHCYTRLHDEANMKQTWSTRRARVLLNAFASCLFHRVNQVLESSSSTCPRGISKLQPARAWSEKSFKRVARPMPISPEGLQIKAK